MTNDISRIAIQPYQLIPPDRPDFRKTTYSSLRDSIHMYFSNLQNSMRGSVTQIIVSARSYTYIHTQPNDSTSMQINSLFRDIQIDAIYAYICQAVLAIRLNVDVNQISIPQQSADIVPVPPDRPDFRKTRAISKLLDQPNESTSMQINSLFRDIQIDAIYAYICQAVLAIRLNVDVNQISIPQQSADIVPVPPDRPDFRKTRPPCCNRNYVVI